MPPLMSTPVIFVASITAIAVFVTPGLYEPATLLRIGTVLLAGLAGPVGLAAAFFGFCSVSSAPKHWACHTLRRIRSRSSRFPRMVFCAATTGSCPGAGSISGKSGRRENGGHEAADRTFYPGGVNPQCGNCSAGRRHPAKRFGVPGAVAGRCQRGVSVHPFGAGSGNVAEQSALPCGAAGTDSRAFYGTGAHPSCRHKGCARARVSSWRLLAFCRCCSGRVVHPSRKLERLGAGAVVVCSRGRRGLPAGLAGQLHWYRLFPPAQPAAAGWNVPVYAEYFAGALLCSARSARRTVWLPVWGFAVQAAALLGGALLFGSSTYPRLELLRAWSGGSFSRMDALLLLLWLLCAVYRASMLCAAVRLLWQQPEAEVQP